MNELQRTILVKMNEGFDIPVINEPSPYKLAQAGGLRNLRLVQLAMGKNHPLSQSYEENIGDLNLYVDSTKALIEDSRRRWGRTLGITRSNQADVLNNLVRFDIFRQDYFNTVADIFQTLEFGSFNPTGYETIIYQESGSNQSGEYTLKRYFAKSALDYTLEDKVYPATRDPRVPFLYIFGEDWQKVQPSIPETLDILADLYQGNPLPFSEMGHKVFPKLGLSDEARTALDSCGCMVLNPDKTYFITSQAKANDLQGNMLTPIGEIPWIVDGYPNVVPFVSWVLPQLEHETRHIADFKFLNGGPNSSILEARAFCQQLDYLKSNKFLIHSDDTLDLKVYAAIIAGNPAQTHYEINILRSNKATLLRLSEEKVFQLAQNLGV